MVISVDEANTIVWLRQVQLTQERQVTAVYMWESLA